MEKTEKYVKLCEALQESIDKDLGKSRLKNCVTCGTEHLKGAMCHKCFGHRFKAIGIGGIK